MDVQEGERKKTRKRGMSETVREEEIKRECGAGRGHYVGMREEARKG